MSRWLHIAFASVLLLLLPARELAAQSVADFYRGKTITCFIGYGVGGSFDVLAGRTRRAPRWMQRTGLEWAYRIWQEPGRMWKRYAVTNSIFCWMLLREFFRPRR